MTNFVLLHGAWHGGWCWERVAAILRDRGHRVTTPTQTGLGERRHLLSSEITLTTFGEDLRLHLEYEDLRDVVAVGHSFGGSALTYAADRAADRILRLVYLDSMIVLPGETPFDTMPPEVVALRRQMAMDHSGGLSLPPPPAAAFGVGDPADAEWLEARLTPQPFSVFGSRLEIDGRVGAGLPAEYVLCSEPVYGPLAASRARARELGWPVREIATGHDAMVTAPEALADMLEGGR